MSVTFTGSLTPPSSFNPSLRAKTEGHSDNKTPNRKEATASCIRRLRMTIWLSCSSLGIAVSLDMSFFPVFAAAVCDVFSSFSSCVSSQQQRRQHLQSGSIYLDPAANSGTLLQNESGLFRQQSTAVVQRSKLSYSRCRLRVRSCCTDLTVERCPCAVRYSVLQAVAASAVKCVSYMQYKDPTFRSNSSTAVVLVSIISIVRSVILVSYHTNYEFVSVWSVERSK